MLKSSFYSGVEEAWSHVHSANYCIFTNENDRDRLIPAIHVDDGLINNNNCNKLVIYKKNLVELHKEFEVTSNEINTYLGLQIERLADSSIFLHQKVYTKKILQRFQMENANAVVILANENHQLCVEAHKNYAGETETRKSTTDFVLKLGDSVKVWRSTTMTTRQRVTVSTTEAEYIAASQTVKDFFI
ncbi:uncharacterized protein LOC116186855 [Apis dorsata]|uniref:uncharacterized protein LOC116186855 n=1 Tax=Apis dorsata TaxID=7462 RepID=UPI001293F09C|nr:uncharacterized protein LOC116186855 [Apis dorsata]